MANQLIRSDLARRNGGDCVRYHSAAHQAAHQSLRGFLFDSLAGWDDLFRCRSRIVSAP